MVPWHNVLSRSQPESAGRGLFTLRFGVAETERAYVRNKAPKLIRTSSQCALVVVVMTLASVLLSLYNPTSSEPWVIDQVTSDLRWIRRGIHGAVGVMSLCFIAFAQLGGFDRCCSAASVEYFVVAWFHFAMIGMCFSDYHYLAKLLGNYDDVEGPITLRFTDSFVLLLIDTVLTMTHLTLPIRWVVLLPLEATAVCTYSSLVFVVGSSEPHSAFGYLVMLVGLALCSAFGKRTIEGHERNLFMNTLREKALRAQLEFQLSEKSSARPPRENAECESTVSHAQTLGHLCSQAGAAPTSLAQELTSIAELGRRERWLIPTEHLELVPTRLLGGGAFGIVIAGALRGTPVAVKISRSINDFWSCFEQLANELRILRHVRSPNIVQFHGACVDFIEGELAVVEELVEGPSLEAFLTGGKGALSRGPPPDAVRHHLVIGLCRGLQCLHAHEPCIVHGDLKPSNVRVEELRAGPRAKLLDFGLSRLIKGNPRPLGGTLQWMAPEIASCKFKGSPELPPLPSPAADIFSFGRLMFFIATEAPPLGGFEDDDIRVAAERGEVLPQRWPSDPSYFARRCAAISDRCLLQDPAARPQIKDIHEDFARPDPCLDGPGASSGADPADRSTGTAAEPAGHVPWQEGLRSVRGAMAHVKADFSSTPNLQDCSNDRCCEPGSSDDRRSSPPASSI